MTSKLIALDADGVLLDYGAAYAGAWERAFGVRPVLRNPLAYWPIDRWGVPRLVGNDLERFRACLDDGFWRSVPAIAGALDACHALVGQGYELTCVTALASRFQPARATNLRALGFPLNDVIAVEDRGQDQSPKAEAIRRLKPVAFVDDFLPYHRGVPVQVHKALIIRDPNGSPNVGAELSIVDSQHEDLSAFARAWIHGSLARRPCWPAGLSLPRTPDE